MLPTYRPFLSEHSGAGNQLTEGSDKRPEIQARMDDRAEARDYEGSLLAEVRRLGIPLGEMQTRLLLDVLQRCIGVTNLFATLS